MSVYLDYAAATPLDSSVAEVMQPYLSELFYNPSSIYLAGKAVNADIKSARESIAKIIGAKPSEVIFTAGATEANNLAIQGAMQQFPGKTVLISAIEHDSVLKPAQRYAHTIIAVNSQGLVSTQELKQKITDETVLISMIYANNEIGVVQPIRDISRVVADIRTDRLKRGIKTPLYLHIDAAQAANYLDIHVSKLGVDMMSINGGKIYGPKQTGFLYLKTGIQLQAQILGGGQERGLRSGTENVAGIIGLSQALQVVSARKKSESKRLQELQQLFIYELQQLLPKATINGSLKKRLPNNVHITIPGIDNERIMMELDERGIICATGSACSASSDEPSHVLKAIGLSDDDARSSLRLTMGYKTTLEQLKQTLETLKSICV